jgi:thiamine-monophosphate kinase
MYNRHMTEFELIDRYFTRPARPVSGNNIALGIGDDCALLTPSSGMKLAISTDMLVEGRHFFPGADAFLLGHKSLAVNLSDLAAMGAQPLAFTLALALPSADDAWLAPFAQGLLALADTFYCELIGGDTTKGPLTICITVFGEVPRGAALRRSGALPGDDIWVSGSLGDARLALAGYRNEIALDAASQALAGQRMHQPTPRVSLGLALRGIAHAAIDISDGLGGDLAHILTRSGVGAVLDVDALPAGPVLRRFDRALQRQYTLSGGDDYELCFTAPVEKRDAVLYTAGTLDDVGIAVTRVGRIVATPGLHLVGADGAALAMPVSAFDHFS